MARGMASVVEEGRWLATEKATVEELAARYRHAVEADDHFLFALEDGGRLVGSLSMHPTQTKGVLALGMWILEPWRGRGGGRMLMEAAITVRLGGVHKIELEVFPDNEAAIGLYEAMGFEREGLRRDHLRRLDGSLRSALIMARLFETE